MKILETKNLTKRFNGVHAVNHLSVQFGSGKITGIIGPNGSGKSTLVNLLSGFLSIDGGLIVLNEATQFSKIKPYEISFYGITRTFQNIRLFEQMTVLDNILVVLTERNFLNALFEKHKEYHLKKAEAVLTQVGLWGKRDDLAINLSYGQRKLLEIARAVSMDADIYLLDEPFAGLFPEMVKIISSVILDLKAKGKTIILIEHNMTLIRELSDRVVVMDSGELLAEGEPEQVLAQKEVIEAYLGE